MAAPVNNHVGRVRIQKLVRRRTSFRVTESTGRDVYHMVWERVKESAESAVLMSRALIRDEILEGGRPWME